MIGPRSGNKTGAAALALALAAAVAVCVFGRPVVALEEASDQGPVAAPGAFFGDLGRLGVVDARSIRSTGHGLPVRLPGFPTIPSIHPSTHLYHHNPNNPHTWHHQIPTPRRRRHSHYLPASAASPARNWSA